MPPASPLDQYRSSHPTSCSNFENDDTLSRRDKDRFIAHLNTFPGASPYDEYVEAFFHDPANSKLGPIVSLEPDEILGTVRRLTAFARRFSVANGFDHDPADAEDYVRSLATLSPRALQDTLSMLFRASSTIAPHTMWSYRNPMHPDDPFEEVDKIDLACRLGLPSYGLVEHVAFGHDLAAEAYRPTCFDAGLADEWQPGGTTKPLSDCASKYLIGLPEVVHDPIAFRDIATQLSLL